MPDYSSLLFAQCLLCRAKLMLKPTLNLTVMNLGSFLDWLYFCFAAAVAAVSCCSSVWSELWLRQTPNQILTWAASAFTQSWCHLLKGHCLLWLILSFVQSNVPSLGWSLHSIKPGVATVSRRAQWLLSFNFISGGGKHFRKLNEAADTVSYLDFLRWQFRFVKHKDF